MLGQRRPWWRWPAGQTHPQALRPVRPSPRHRGRRSRVARSPVISWDWSGGRGLSRGQRSDRGWPPGSPLALPLTAPWAGRSESASQGRGGRRPWHGSHLGWVSRDRTWLTRALRSSGAWGRPDTPGSPCAPGTALWLVQTRGGAAPLSSLALRCLTPDFGHSFPRHEPALAGARFPGGPSP